METDPVEDYARGFVPFLDCTIYLDSKPLIPCSESEYWIEKVIEELKTHSSIRVLDIFAGSGALGVAVLKHIPESSVDFGEIDSTHLPTIRKNVRENGIAEDRTRIFQSDIFSGIPEGRYDTIVANPPYIARERIGRVQESVLEHEPHLALFADEEGFALIRKTIEEVRRHLAPEGTLYVEHEPEHAERIRTAAEENGMHAEVRLDQYGITRWSRLTVA